MQQIVITHVGGAALAAAKTLALEPEKIVSTKAIGGACEFIYAETIDRRVSPKRYRAANTKTQIDQLIAGTKIDFTVYDLADGTTSVLTVQEKFIEDMVSGSEWINLATQAGVSVRFVEGAWLEKKIFVSGVIGDFATVASTTTTAAPVTTTTTAVPVTTTTTAAVTTTTTAAITTTTTTA